jgi:hypothetical protein
LAALFAHGASAPALIDRSGSGTTSSGSISICVPSPVHRVHAPCGELKEKMRGSSSGIEVPQRRHAKRSEKSIVRPSPSSPRSGRIWTSTSPSARPTAASTDSVRRLRTSARITRRSTTTAMSCL